MRIDKILVTLGTALLMSPAAASAVTQTITANIAFDTPLSMTKVNDIQFGTVKAGVTGMYVINASGTISTSSPGLWLYGSPAAAVLTLAGSTTQSITVSTGSYVENGGVTPSGATCRYKTNSPASCDAGLTVAAAGAAATLSLGVQVTANGTQAPGVAAAPSFTVMAVYN